MRSPSVWLTACSAALAIAIAGCGGSDNEARVAGPKIEGAVANELAALSDEVADDLDGGDACAAKEAAARLRARVTQAINDGKVPQVYLEDLSGVVNEIEVQIPACAPAAEDQKENGDDDGEHGKGKKKGKHKGNKRQKGNRKGQQEPVETGTLPAETATTETTTDTTTTGTTTTTDTATTKTTTTEDGR